MAEAGIRIQAGGHDIQFGNDRLAIAFVDVNRDGPKDLVVIPAGDRKPRCYRNLSAGATDPRFAEPVLLKTRTGEDLVATGQRPWHADRPAFL